MLLPKRAAALLRAGANIHAAADDGTTPLALAGALQEVDSLASSRIIHSITLSVSQPHDGILLSMIHIAFTMLRSWDGLKLALLPNLCCGLRSLGLHTTTVYFPSRSVHMLEDCSIWECNSHGVWHSIRLRFLTFGWECSCHLSSSDSSMINMKQKLVLVFVCSNINCLQRVTDYTCSTTSTWHSY